MNKSSCTGGNRELTRAAKRQLELHSGKVKAKRAVGVPVPAEVTERLLNLLEGQRDMELISRKGVPQIAARLTVLELSKLCAVSTGFIMQVITGESGQWERLRAKGWKPDYWRMRLTQYGTIIHYKRCAVAEYRWRLGKGAIGKKEFNRLMNETKLQIRSIANLPVYSQKRRIKLRMMYFSLKGWTTERAAQAVKSRTERKNAKKGEKK